MFPEVSKALSGHCEAGEEETLAHFVISMPCVPCWAAPGLADWLAEMVGVPPAGTSWTRHSVYTGFLCLCARICSSVSVHSPSQCMWRLTLDIRLPSVIT